MKYPAILIFLLLLLHVPFLSSDPDHNLSFSRDAFTDEGLYSCQVRNYVHTGAFRIDESDAVIKSPLFSGVLLAAFRIGGVSLETARFTVLILFLLVLFYVFRKQKLLLTLLVLILFTLKIVFHYQHLALSEMLSTSMLLLAWSFMAGFGTSKNQLPGVMLCCFFIALSWYFKFQYIYMAVWPIAFYFLVLAEQLVRRTGNGMKYLRVFVFAVFSTIAFGFLYYVLWFLPNESIFNYVVTGQEQVVIAGGEWLGKMIDFNISTNFETGNYLLFSLLFVACVIAAPVAVYRNRTDRRFVYSLAAAGIWCLLESYKPAITYLPGRYLVSTYVSMGLFSCIVIRGLIQPFPRKRYVVFGYLLLLLLPVLANVYSWYQDFNSRKYILTDAAKFVSDHETNGGTIAGPWAPSLSWNTTMRSVPVWKDYFNDHSIIQNLNPDIIVSETDEEDSGEAFKNDGIELEKISSPDKYTFKIRGWEVNIYPVIKYR